MCYELFSSLTEMLAPETLSTLEGRPVRRVRCVPIDPPDSASGCCFLRVETNDGQGPCYIVKRISMAWDWIMRATDDQRGRSVAVWQHGLLDRLPPEIAHGVLACARDGNGWAILMRDVSRALMPPDAQRMSREENERFLDAMAALHATFWAHPALADPALGLCSIAHHYTCLAPETGRREAGGPNEVPRMIVEGWDLFQRLVAPDVAGVVHELAEDPRALCDALSRYPHTLIHGDWRLANLGLRREQPAQVILLDWQFVGRGTPAMDLAWYLATNHMALPVTPDEAVAIFRRHLARRLGSRFDERWWQPQLQLSLLGGLVRCGGLKAWFAIHGPDEAKRAHDQADLLWWSGQVRHAVRWL